MPMPMPYIWGCMGIPMGITIIGIGIGMFGFMAMGHTAGRGGTGMCWLCRRDPPPSDTMDPRRLPLALMRRSRDRTSCCEDDGVGMPECIEAGREPGAEPVP